MNKKHSIDMCSGSLADKILLFALPLMASSLLQLLFNAADVVVSRDLGAGRHDNVSHSVHTTMTLALISGIAMMVFGVAMVRQLLEWVSSPTDVIGLATVYLRIYFLGMPANLLYNFGAAILRAQGDTQRPLYYLTFAGIVNVALNLIFVIALHMDVAGVALATIIAQYISAALVVRCLMQERGPLHLDLKKLGLRKKVVIQIFQVGLPAGFQGIVFSLSNVVIQSSLNSFDDPVLVAGSAAGANLESFVYASMNTFYQAAISFVGQNYGAAKCGRVDRVARLCVGFAVVFGLVLGNLVYLFGTPLAGIYAPGEPDVIQQALVRMGYICCPYFICGIMDVLVGVLRGLGSSIIPMFTSIVGACGLRLLWVAFVFPVYRTPACLYLSYPVTWSITALFHLLFLMLVVRRRAFSKVRSNGPAYLSTEGLHPEQP